MSDDKSNRGPQDRSRINVNEDYELDYWSRQFGVTRDQLREAVKDAGTSVAAVQAHLKGKKA